MRWNFRPQQREIKVGLYNNMDNYNSLLYDAAYQFMVSNVLHSISPYLYNGQLNLRSQMRSQICTLLGAIGCIVFNPMFLLLLYYLYEFY